VDRRQSNPTSGARARDQGARSDPIM
jgi:hypothetical protein